METGRLNALVKRNNRLRNGGAALVAALGGFAFLGGNSPQKAETATRPNFKQAMRLEAKRLTRRLCKLEPVPLDGNHDNDWTTPRSHYAFKFDSSVDLDPVVNGKKRPFEVRQTGDYICTLRAVPILHDTVRTAGRYAIVAQDPSQQSNIGVPGEHQRTITNQAGIVTLNKANLQPTTTLHFDDGGHQQVPVGQTREIDENAMVARR